ncbi:MAG TPA: hypothetical protein VGJ06_10460 [Candidatus Acidoferrum sp.]|jgi:hypothetical protein
MHINLHHRLEPHLPPQAANGPISMTRNELLLRTTIAEAASLSLSSVLVQGPLRSRQAQIAQV